MTRPEDRDRDADPGPEKGRAGERAADRTLVEVLAVPVMVVVGAMVAVQAQINGRLAAELGGGLRGGAAAAVVSFGTGTVLVVGLTLALPGPRRGAVRIARAVRRGTLRPWHLLGGLGGASLVASQGLAVASIGVALFTVAMVAGQTVSGLVVDRVGLGPSGVARVSPGRVAGAALTVGAVVLGVAGRLAGTDPASPGVLALAVLPLLAGVAIAWQQAVNGVVSSVGGPVAAAANNFALGLAALLVLLVVALLAAPGELRAPPSTWWLYVGGPVGVLFIALSARLVVVHGVLVLGLCTVAGLVVGSVLLDALGPEPHLGPATVLGAVLALVGVTVAALASRRHGGRGGAPSQIVGSSARSAARRPPRT